jgi:hypothetical protein
MRTKSCKVGGIDRIDQILDAWKRYKRVEPGIAPVTFSYSGRLIGLGYESPTPFDVAVSLGRICRYTGNGTRWYPVILHTFVVADLVPKHLKFDALNHDNPECITGDIPKPYKTPEMEAIEHALQEMMYRDWSHAMPTKAQYRVIKEADHAALYGEVHTIGSYGLQRRYPKRSPRAEKMTVDYIMKYPPEECLTPSGTAVVEFLRRYHEYLEYKR